MIGEFATIDRYFAPLAKGRPGTYDLKNDAATLALPEGEELVVTLDTMTEGVHFLPADPPSEVAKKLLRVNLSDLAAMGAQPVGYLLSLALPKTKDEDWVAAFASGLAADQEAYGLYLLGGDTTRIEGPLALSLTALGRVGRGRALTRSGANPGDLVFVSGSIGDAALGLKLLQGADWDLEQADREWLAERYRLPRPRSALGPRLLGLASACIDVSDGLLADLGHIAEGSALAIEIEAGKLPLSRATGKLLEQEPDLLESVLTGGDDYELAFTVPPARAAEIEALSITLDLAITRIGKVKAGSPAVIALDRDGAPLDVKRRGWTHF